MARSVGVPETSLIQLPVSSVNADYGTDDDLRRMAVDAIDEFVQRAAASFRKS